MSKCKRCMEVVMDSDWDRYPFEDATGYVDEVEEEMSELIEPPHYRSNPSGVEAIEVTQHLPFCLGNAMKYIWRCGLKRSETVEVDLRKAIWYLEKEIERTKNGEGEGEGDHV